MEDELKEYIVTVTSTWLVEAESEEEARDIFSDGTMLDRREVAVLNK
jgi:hypothetical protein